MPANPRGKLLLYWKIAEFEHFERTMLWYIVAGVVTVGLLVYAILAANYLFAVIILLGAIILLYDHFRKPGKIDAEITQEGVQVGKHFHPFDTLQEFWLVYNPPESKWLYLRFKAFWHSEISIPLEHMNPLKIREILLNYLPEDVTEESESLSDVIRRSFRL
ncbi:MAG: hypothetical protein AAB733_01660 [Patescibacteria group bacterium]